MVEKHLPQIAFTPFFAYVPLKLKVYVHARTKLKKGVILMGEVNKKLKYKGFRKQYPRCPKCGRPYAAVTKARIMGWADTTQYIYFRLRHHDARLKSGAKYCYIRVNNPSRHILS